MNSSHPGNGASEARLQACGDGSGLSYYAHRQVIGYLGLFMPVLLFVISSLRPTEGLTPWVILDSVSAYYYGGAVAVFTGVLFALALFLATYRGYKGCWYDSAIGIFAGSCALLVALFPTEAPDGVERLSWWCPIMGKIHGWAATLLFGSFVVFSLWLFRMKKEDRDAEEAKRKGRRNTIYLVCGILIAASMLWALVSLCTGKPIFWAEVVALWAFAVSWLTKGRAHETAGRYLRSAGRLLRGGRAGPARRPLDSR